MVRIALLTGTCLHIAVLAIAPPYLHGQAGVEQVTERSESAQRLFTEIINAPPNASVDHISRKVDALRMLGDSRFLVRQAVIYEATVTPSAEGFRRGWAYVVLARSMIRIEHYPVAVADLLYANDQSLRKEARYVFQQALTVYGRGGFPDLSHFRDYIIGPNERPEISNPLRRALFEATPNGAFFFYSGESPTEIQRDLVTDYRRKWRVVDNALFTKQWLDGIPHGRIDGNTVEALRQLAESKHWWSRLFVAEIMVQNEEFRDPDLVIELAQDENALVRNSINSLKTPDPLRVAPLD